MVSTTRGPLPSGIYWRRRLVLLSIALVLVLGVGKVLDLGSDASSAPESAEQASAPISPTFTVTTDPTADSNAGKASKAGKGGNGKGRAGKGGKGDAATPTTPSSTTPTTPAGVPTPAPTPTPTVAPPLPDPTGPCADGEVLVTPTVAAPVAGSDVTFQLNLQTATSQACTWTLSPDNFAMKVTQGRDDVWTSAECPNQIPTQDLVVRRASVTQVPVVWDARRSDEYCSDRTAWALPGAYTVYAAALESELTDVSFDLVVPVAPTVTQTAQPDPPAATATTG